MSDKKRIIFLDLMRAFAVLMMVQGHTVDSLLSEEFRTFDSIFYSAWHTFRGFTAPIFMFTSGVVFTYLLRSNYLPFRENPRVKKGLKRFLLLLVIGYLLRYPTYKIIDFTYVSDKQWLIFFGVDALHLIAFGLLFVLVLAYISEKIKIRDSIIFTMGALFFIIIYPMASTFNWAEVLPLPIAAYFYRDTGSLFPLFPWAGYVIGGGVLGSYLAKNPAVCSSKNFSFRLSLSGFSFVALSIFITQLGKLILPFDITWTFPLSLVFYRIGIVLVLSGLMSLIAVKFSDIPAIIKLIGRNTLLIYVVHLIILYCCAWMPGLYKYYSRSLSLELTLGLAIFMIFMMTGMVIFIERIRIYRKEKISAAAA